MSGSDVEHVSCYLDGSPHHFPRPSSQSSCQRFEKPPDGALNAALTSPPASFLPTTTYSPRPDLVDSQLGHPSTSTTPSEYPDNQPSLPNPDDYYRQLRTPLADDSGVNTSDTSATGPSTGTNERSTRVDDAPSLPTDTLVSSRVRCPQYRSISSPSYNGLQDGPIKSPQIPSSTPRHRQASFKDLVNKFNNNIDQILPLPSVSKSKEASRAGSPASSFDGQNRSRASSRLRETREASTQRQPTVQWDAAGSAVPDFSRDLVPPPLRIPDNHGAHLGDPTSSERRHLFSELLPVDTSFHSPGLGLPARLRRRGSDGSIPSPNPASLDPQDLPPGLSPLTPTAWYLGHTQFLETVNTGGNTSNHRRARSDLAGCQFMPVFADTTRSMAIPAPLQPGGFLETPHSRSRIPISSRRFSPDSDSDISSRPLGPNSTFSGRYATHGALPAKGASRLPILSPKGSPGMVDDGRQPFATTSHGRREITHGRTRRQLQDRNSLLTAYIAAPPPKKSPPLRSSRPRQPVTNAISSPSRSKVGQTVSNFQKQISRDREPRNSRSRERRLPELGNVDFATRRQRIQQAFNRTVQENERKEEEAAELRRREQEQGEGPYGAHPAREQPAPEDSTIDGPAQAEDTETVIDESTQICDEEKEPATEKDDFRELPQLHIDTSISTHENSETNADDHLVTMDSPTLGLSGVTPNTIRLHPKPNNLPPSATTSGSTDTHVTAFDHEPQTGLSRRTLNMSHRTLLNQIMQIRESSSSSSSCDEPDYSFSDNDDRESIPIMLREASYIEGHQGSESNQGNRNVSMKRAQAGDGTQNRWSMSSWSSSLRNQPSGYEQCEESGDEVSHRPASADSDPTTQSCSAASSTPPSASGHRAAEPVSHGNQVPEQKNGETVQRNIYMPSNAPSLARQGGWDSKRVTQLYLEELARGRGHHFALPAIRAGPESRPLDVDQRTDGRTDSLTDDPVLVPRFDDILSSDRLGHAASLVFRDDWEHASPSIADWMQIAAEDEGVSSDDKGDSSAMCDGVPTPRVVASGMQQTGPETPDSGLGLAINVKSPQEPDSEETPPPPLPRRSPPPPPEQEEDSHPPHGSSDQPPSHTSSSTGLAQLGPVNSAGSSENSLLQRLDPVPSPQLVDSSTTSLVPSNPEHASLEAQKRSPSPEQRRLKKRLHVIKELIDTEYTFGRDMKVVDDIYKGTSSSCLDLSAEDVKVLFANSDQIVQFSTAFQDALKNAAKSVYVMPKSQRWSSKRSARNSNSNASREVAGDSETSELEKDQLTFIGEAFMANMSQMEKVYTDYLKNHDAANKKLQALQRNAKVAIWLKECRDWAADLTTAWDLDSLLVKPVQRIVKYPLLLDQLLSSTPSDHPDRESIVKALEEVTNISVRINEMKKRADLVGQVVGRKRKESDVRAGLSKAFGRRTEKLKQHVGLSDMFEDKEYDVLSQRFGDGYFQLQVVMRDVEVYTQAAQASMDHLNDFVGAIEGLLDVSQSNYSELEGKWRELRIALHEVMTIALPDHVSATLTQKVSLRQ